MPISGKSKIYKVVAVTPAGRKKNLKLLRKYVEKCDIIDEWQIWLNTDNPEDVDYIHQMKSENPKIEIKEANDKAWEFPEEQHKFCSHRNHGYRCYRIHNFFKNCRDENSVYIRFDDDICFMEDNAIEELLKFRVENEEYLLVYPLIVNSPFLNYILHQRKVLDLESLKDCKYEWNCTNCFYKGRAICDIHNQFIEDVKNNNLEKYKIGNVLLRQQERVLINCISWFGGQFKSVAMNEELDLTNAIPKRLGKINCVHAGPIMAHFSSYYQRFQPTENLDDIWDKYEKLI